MGRAKREQTNSKPVYVDRKILDSAAYWALSGVAAKYLMVFLARRQMHIVKASREWVIKNNGEIVFPYSDAKNRYGVKNPGTHSRNLRELHAKGFIDVNHLGGGMEGDPTTFSISKRWKKYETPDFEEVEWPKDSRKRGNPQIAKYGRGRSHRKNRTNYYP